MEELLKEINLKKQEIENLTKIVANKIISDYDIETPLKDELNETRLKVVALEDFNTYLKHENKQLKDKLEKIKEYINHPDFIDWHIGVDEKIFRKNDILSIIESSDSK